ncbi:tyrosine-type recombinase/integrase [Candidatus Ulvibacter alkanivorans]|uniref:tyrosine-type recombinase/integrase n=1 Tax=Candidatus Ulvibacter alkanivorans TaxID=2267620 RepID=UPI001443B965|nr:site-specific integrase [Candidatus Ulvibacter alkanivorans]
MPDITYPHHLTETALNEFFKVLQTRKRIVGRDKVVTGVKDTTIANYWNKLNPFFIWLETGGHIDKSPLAYIKKPRCHYENKPAIKKKDIERLFSTVTLLSRSPFLLKRDTAILSTLFFTGVRKTELLSLQVRDINLDKNYLIVRGATSKSKRTRQIPINPTLRIHLSDYLKERQGYQCEYLFVSKKRDDRLTAYGIKHWVRRLNERSGVRFHLHQLRHTFACNLARNNISLPKLQQLMGHTDLRMTERYVRSLGVEHLVDDILKLSIDDSY